MRWEVQVLRKKVDKRLKNLEELNLPNPPEAESVWVRMLIHTADIECLEAYSPKKTLLRCNWMMEPVFILGAYEDLAVQLNDLENAEFGNDEEE